MIPTIQDVLGQTLSSRYLELAKNPGLLDGTSRAPLRGFADVPSNEFYAPRIVHWERWRSLHLEFGTEGMRRLIAGAVRGLNPDLDTALVEKIAKGYVKRLHSVDAGQELTASRIFSGEDVEAMRGHLREAGLLDDEVNRALYRATAQDSDTAGVSRGKRRTLLDENFAMVLPGKAGSREVRVGELFHDDAQFLFTAYNRQMSGAIAMGRLQLRNPRWTPEDADLHPEFLVDGIHSRGDWETLLAKVRAVADEAGDGARNSREADVRRLQFMFDGITGTPSRFDRDHAGLASAIRMVRDYNFVRVMNQVGFAQVAEIGMITGGLGLKTAVSSMPPSTTPTCRTGRACP